MGPARAAAATAWPQSAHQPRPRMATALIMALATSLHLRSPSAEPASAAVTPSSREVMSDRQMWKFVSPDGVLHVVTDAKNGFKALADAYPAQELPGLS